MAEAAVERSEAPPQLGSPTADPGSAPADEAPDPLIPRLPEDQQVRLQSTRPPLRTILLSEVVAVVSDIRVEPSRVNDHRRENGNSLVSGTHRSLVARVERCLLGPCGDEVRWEFWCSPSDDTDPSCDDIRHSVGRPGETHLVLLTYPYDDDLYLADRSNGAAFGPSSTAAERRIREWASWRRDATRRFADLPRTVWDERVDEQLRRITRSATEQYDATRALIALGKHALPAVVRRLDDMRPLPATYVRVQMRPGFFESAGQYSPATVMDMLTLVLSRLGDASLCSALINSATMYHAEHVREACRRRWEAYAMRAIDEGAVSG